MIGFTGETNGCAIRADSAAPAFPRPAKTFRQLTGFCPRDQFSRRILGLESKANRGVFTKVRAMSTATVDALGGAAIGDPQLLKVVLASVGNALTMCDTSARCVGMSSVPTRSAGVVTGLIGVHGNVSGFINVSIGQRFAIKAVEGLLQDRFETLTSQVIDGVGEITNIIVGGIKSRSAGTPWAFSHITVPSVIIGTGYQFAYGKGLNFVCATFEHQDEEAIMLDDRLMQVSISLLRL